MPSGSSDSIKAEVREINRTTAIRSWRRRAPTVRERSGRDFQSLRVGRARHAWARPEASRVSVLRRRQKNKLPPFEFERARVPRRGQSERAVRVQPGINRERAVGRDENKKKAEQPDEIEVIDVATLITKEEISV